LYPSSASVLRCTCRASPTTAWSDWNCANDNSSMSRARIRPTWRTRLTAMLYDGENDERSGYVRVEASPATARGSNPGCQSTTA
jgi:hypothetical protein